MLPMLFGQLIRRDGKGAVFADNRSFAFEQERVLEDELYSLARSMLNWAISFLSESGQGVIYEPTSRARSSSIAAERVRHRVCDSQALPSRLRRGLILAHET